MGKKRFNSATLTKNYATSSPRAQAAAGAASDRLELSVTDKLSKLRLEELRHERNTAGSSRLSVPADVANRQIIGDPEISALLGLEYVEPASRIKPRSRGHLAPKSWDTPTRRKRHDLAYEADNRRDNKIPSLVEIGLKVVANDVEAFLGCGMNYLPAYMRSYILSSLTRSSNSEIIWNDIVPSEEADDEITALDIHYSKPTPVYIRRLSGLRTVSVSLSQMETGLVFALPSVLQELSIVVDFSSQDLHLPTTRSHATWRKLSSYFVALRDIKIDLRRVDPSLDQVAVTALWKLLLHGPDWHYAFDTVKRITIVADSSMHLAVDYHKLVSEELRVKRRPGKHVEVLVTHS